MMCGVGASARHRNESDLSIWVSVVLIISYTYYRYREACDQTHMLDGSFCTGNNPHCAANASSASKWNHSTTQNTAFHVPFA